MNRQDIGFPEVANLYRTKQEAFYPSPTYLLPRGDIIPLGEDNAFYKDWMQYNRNALIDKLYNADQSIKRNLLPRYPQLRKSGNKAQVLFGVHNDDMEMIREHYNRNKMSGGALTFSDSTAGTDMNRVEREKQRIKIIDRLRKGFEDQPTVQQPPEAQDLLMSREADDKLQFDLLIASITERLINGIVDGSVYRDLLQVAQYLIRNIWKFNDFEFFQNFEDSLIELTSLILGVIQSYESNQLDNFYSKRSLQYAKPSQDLINRLVLYVQLNVSGIGRDEKYRKSLAKSSVKGFKETIDKASKELEERLQVETLPPERVPNDDEDDEPVFNFDRNEQPPAFIEETETNQNIMRNEQPPAPQGSGRRKYKARSRLIKLYK